MDWDYFLKDGKYKYKRLPKPKRTVKIVDISENYLVYSLEVYKYISKNLDEYNRLWKEDYIDTYINGSMYETEVEDFSEFFNRNSNNFLGDLKMLKGNWEYVEDIYYWWISKGSYSHVASAKERKEWKVLCLDDEMEDMKFKDSEDENEDDRIFEIFIEKGFIELKTAPDKEYLINDVSNNLTIQGLNKMAKDNNIKINGKKQDKIDILLKSIEDGLINTSIIFYRPAKNFDIWINKLHIKYIEVIEKALATFNYPDSYIAEVWRETIGVNDSDLITSIIVMRQKKYLKICYSEEEILKLTERAEEDSDPEKYIISIPEEKMEPSSEVKEAEEELERVLKIKKNLENQKRKLKKTLSANQKIEEDKGSGNNLFLIMVMSIVAFVLLVILFRKIT